MSTTPNEAVLSDAGIWKTWTLLCVAEAARLGLSPLASAQLHVLLYLANTLAPLFNVTRVRGRVLKRGPFPFYPDVQREIDRLAFSGVLKIERVDFGPKGHLAAHYDLAPSARELQHRLLAASAEARRTSRLFSELVAACFGKFLASQSAIGPVDANYGNTDIVENEVVDFSEWQDENKNMEVARYLMAQLKALQPHVERDGVRLYCDYLDQAMAAT
ncbi:MAG: hypothetical protein KF796_14125 [Ramlibacter sp.]|nr:hypothetical protein [Ramlibacter sp.]